MNSVGCSPNVIQWSAITDHSIKLLKKEEDLRPVYTEIRHKIKETVVFQDISENRLLMKFLQDNEARPFIRKLSEKLSERRPTDELPEMQFTVKDFTHRQYFLPNRDAIERIAHHYSKKYEIPLVVSNLENIQRIINHFKGLTQTLYFGIVVYEEEHSDHAIPILCYLEVQEQSELLFECAIMDSLGVDEKDQACHLLYQKTLDRLNEIEKQRQFMSINRSQFLPYLGATRSLTLLRNALLYLKGKKEALPLHFYLNDFLKKETNQLIDLPAQWSYTDQRQETRGDELQVIRNIFRESLGDFRKKYQKEVKLECVLDIFGENAVEKINPKHKTNRLASGCFGPHTFQLYFVINQFTFGYLFEKARRNKEALDKLNQQPQKKSSRFPFFKEEIK